MNDVVIGYGEIGKAVKEVFCPDARTVDKNFHTARIGRVNVMHICFPYDKDFVHNVQAYMIHYEPKHVVVWSTVQIGTCKKIGREVIHSPVEGRHPNLANSIRKMTRWIGYNDQVEANFFKKYIGDIQYRLTRNTNHTEALKLLSTTEYGVNIVFAEYKAMVANSIKMPFELTKEWNADYNELYDDDPRFQKYLLDPPEGKIGGHCVRENSILLNEKYPDDWVRRIYDNF